MPLTMTVCSFGHAIMDHFERNLHPALLPQEFLLSDVLHVFAPDLLSVELPEEPVVVRDEPVKLAIPFFGQTMVEFFNKRKQGPPGREPFFMSIDRDFLVPAEGFSIFGEAEPVEEVFSTDQRDVPKTRNAARVFFDGNFNFQLLEKL